MHITSVSPAELVTCVRSIRELVDDRCGLSLEQTVLLEQLYGNALVSVTALADAGNVRAATMSRMISSMVKLGLVEKHVDETDGRGTLVGLTALGKRMRAKALRSYREATAIYNKMNDAAA